MNKDIFIKKFIKDYYMNYIDVQDSEPLEIDEVVRIAERKWDSITSNKDRDSINC